jgi:membrane associated rhomboid family serine protease
LHGDIWHILFNMLALWVIGRELEFYWGTKEFFRFYLVIGLGLIALYSGLTGVPDGIGHFAHLRGMVVGWLYMKFIKPDLRWGENIFNRKTRRAGLSKAVS